MTIFKKLFDSLDVIESELKEIEKSGCKKPDLVKTSVQLTLIKDDFDKVLNNDEKLILKIKHQTVFKKLVKLTVVLSVLIILYIIS